MHLRTLRPSSYLQFVSLSFLSPHSLSSVCPLSFSFPHISFPLLLVFLLSLFFFFFCHVSLHLSFFFPSLSFVISVPFHVFVCLSQPISLPSFPYSLTAILFSPAPSSSLFPPPFSTSVFSLSRFSPHSPNLKPALTITTVQPPTPSFQPKCPIHQTKTTEWRTIRTDMIY